MQEVEVEKENDTKPTSEISNISLFPKELLALIFSFIDINYFSNILLTSKQWKKTGKPIRDKKMIELTESLKNRIKILFPTEIKKLEQLFIRFRKEENLENNLNKNYLFWKNKFKELLISNMRENKYSIHDSLEYDGWIYLKTNDSDSEENLSLIATNILFQEIYFDWLFIVDDKINEFVKELFGDLNTEKDCRNFIYFLNTYNNCIGTDADGKIILLQQIIYNRSDTFLAELSRLISHARQKFTDNAFYFMEALCNANLEPDDQRLPDQITEKTLNYFIQSCLRGDKKNNIEALSKIIHSFPEPLSRTHEKQFYYCIKLTCVFGNLEILKLLWDNRRKIIRLPNYYLEDYICFAYYCGHTHIVTYMLDVYTFSPEMQIALVQNAYQLEDNDSLALFIQRGFRYIKRNTPVWTAMIGNWKLMQICLTQKPILLHTIEYDSGSTEDSYTFITRQKDPLISSIEILISDEKRESLVKLIWDNYDEKDKANSLHCLIHNKDKNIVPYFMDCIKSDLQGGKSIDWTNTPNERGYRPIISALQNDFRELVEALLLLPGLNLEHVLDIAKKQETQSDYAVLDHFRQIEQKTAEAEKSHKISGNRFQFCKEWTWSPAPTQPLICRTFEP